MKNSENHVTWDDIDSQWHPRMEQPSNALQFDPDWSAYWRQHLAHRHQLPVASVANESYPLVFQVTASKVLSIEYEGHRFAADHSPQGDLPLDCAHCSVTYEDAAKFVRKGLRALLANELQLVWGIPIALKPTGA